MIGKMEPSHRCSRSTLIDIYIFGYSLSRIVGNLIVILRRLMSRTCKPGPHPFLHTRAPYVMVREAVGRATLILIHHLIPVLHT